MEAAEARLRGEGGAADALFLKCDAGDRSAVFRAVEVIRKTFPGRPLSFLSANAGFGSPTILDGTEVALRRSMDVMLWGAVWLAQAFKPQLLEQGPAPCAIVNTSSMAGMLPGLGSYGVAKHACRTVTESIHEEFQAKGAKHVKVHCLHPALISTAIARSPIGGGGQADGSKPSMMKHGVRSLFQEVLEDFGATPAYLAEQVFRAIADGTFYIVVDQPGPAFFNASDKMQQYHRRMEEGTTWRAHRSTYTAPLPETIQQSSYFVTSMRMIAEHRKNKNEKERAIGSSKL